MQTNEGGVYRLGTGQLGEVCQDLGRTFNLANYGKDPLNTPRRYCGSIDVYFCEFSHGFRHKLFKQPRQRVALL